MTPAEHKTEAETRLTALATAPTGYALTPHDWDAMAVQAHAHLGQALGTSADSLFEEYDTRRNAGASTPEQIRLARRALGHAILADR